MSLCCICEKYKGRNSFHAVKLKAVGAPSTFVVFSGGGGGGGGGLNSIRIGGGGAYCGLITG